MALCVKSMKYLFIYNFNWFKKEQVSNLSENSQCQSLKVASHHYSYLYPQIQITESYRLTFFLKLAYFIFYIFLICNAKLILLENFLNNPFNFTLNLLVIL